MQEDGAAALSVPCSRTMLRESKRPACGTRHVLFACAAGNMYRHAVKVECRPGRSQAGYDDREWTGTTPGASRIPFPYAHDRFCPYVEIACRNCSLTKLIAAARASRDRRPAQPRRYWARWRAPTIADRLTSGRPCRKRTSRPSPVTSPAHSSTRTAPYAAAQGPTEHGCVTSSPPAPPGRPASMAHACGR